MHSRREGLLDGTGDGGDRTPSSWGLDDIMAPAIPTKGGVFRWLRYMVWPSTSSEAAKPMRPTAYLDGLRGFAAFLVYIHHHQLWAHGASNFRQAVIFENAFGWQGEYHFSTFVFVRNFFTGGHIAVALFYVISGYVLSTKALSLLQSGDLVKLGDSLASSFFRRWFRLYIPCIVTTFIYITTWHVFGYWNVAAKAKATYGEEVWNWYAEFKNFSFLFKEGPIWVSYNTHLWSIPLEMRGSMVIFMACLALSRATTKARLLCELLLAYYFLYIVDGYYCALFMAGMLQCDLDALAKRTDGYFPRFLRRLEPYKTLLYYILFVIGMWLAGVPSQTADVKDLRANPGWYWMSYLKPQAVFDPKWFYLFFASNMIMACVPRMRWLKRFFEARFCQFLGRVSFSLYLVHGPILAGLGDRLYHATGYVRTMGTPAELAELANWANAFPLPKGGPMGLEVAFLAPHIIILPFTLWMADIVTRLVDEPAVRFAQWMFKRTLGGAQEPKPEDPVALMRLA
ncbi:acyltransferase family-domain-containing protein [Lasiosphaeria hispida]|uniref:Acyltransferase family-domain-containing protein n=1 Tax=Lasiosphaeria hispida TaxID=260671 RepID=A0AAJ0MDM7_9PEZI|nr:acyltransferase family-domain-containing protein [Lasiosphaeria hispida]